MRKIFINTLKTAAAAILAILIAERLGLAFAVSAGIVAILTIQPTKKETLRTAAGRLYAFLAALLIAYVCFQLLGVTNEGFFLYLVIFILCCQYFGWYSAMAMDSVLISHFLTVSNMGREAVLNELAIFAIGVGIGILVNLHLRKNTDYMERLKRRTDEQIRLALSRMSERILDKDLTDYNGSCFQRIDASVREAKDMAQTNYLNQFGKKDTGDMEYLAMRERQIHVLYEMYKRVRRLRTTPVTAEAISDFLKKMSQEYHSENSAEELLEEFYRIDGMMKAAPLPTERAEFEDRAQLYALLRDMEEFLLIKKEFIKNKGK